MLGGKDSRDNGSKFLSFGQGQSTGVSRWPIMVPLIQSVCLSCFGPFISFLDSLFENKIKMQGNTEYFCKTQLTWVIRKLHISNFNFFLLCHFLQTQMKVKSWPKPSTWTLIAIFPIAAQTVWIFHERMDAWFSVIVSTWCLSREEINYGTTEERNGGKFPPQLHSSNLA